MSQRIKDVVADDYHRVKCAQTFLSNDIGVAVLGTAGDRYYFLAALKAAGDLEDTARRLYESIQSALRNAEESWDG